MIVSWLPVLLVHQPLLLDLQFNLGKALEDPVSEFLVVDQDLVLDRAEHAYDRDQVLVLQLLRILFLHNIIELVLGDTARMVVDLTDQEHDLLELVVLVDDVDEFCMRYLLQRTDLLSLVQRLSDVADLVDGLVFAACDGEVHLVVHLLEDLVVLLVIDPPDVDSDALVASFFSRVRRQDLLQLILLKAAAELPRNLHKAAEWYLALVVAVSCGPDCRYELLPLMSYLPE